MPIASSTTTFGRLPALLSMLQARPDWPGGLFAERLGAGERTVRRDVDRLRELGYRVQAIMGPDGGYRLEAGSRVPPLQAPRSCLMVVRGAATTSASSATITEPIAVRPSTQRCSTVVRCLLHTKVPPEVRSRRY